MKKLEKISFDKLAKLSYDPDDVNIRLQHLRVAEILSMIDSKIIQGEDFQFLDEYLQSDLDDADDDFIEIQGDDGVQRNSGLWSIEQKSRLIESLMIRLPLPLFYFDGSRKPWRVIDGLQRLYSIVSFSRGEYRLKDLEYLNEECEGKDFEHLPGYLRRRIMEAEIIAYVINPGTPPDVKYNIFKRINTGGLKLNGQEIRNAFFRGTPANFLRKLSENQSFLNATNFKVSNRRMTDREYVNRFIAFQVFDFKDYNGKMDNFLSEALMNLYFREDIELSELETLFSTSMTRALTIFDSHAFYRLRLDGTTSRQPNKAIFDTLSWNLAELTNWQFENLANRKEEFILKYKQLTNSNPLMYASINDTTGTRNAVITRFSELKTLIGEFLS